MRDVRVITQPKFAKCVAHFRTLRTTRNQERPACDLAHCLRKRAADAKGKDYGLARLVCHSLDRRA